MIMADWLHGSNGSHSSCLAFVAACSLISSPHATVSPLALNDKVLHPAHACPGLSSPLHSIPSHLQFQGLCLIPRI